MSNQREPLKLSDCEGCNTRIADAVECRMSLAKVGIGEYAQPLRECVREAVGMIEHLTRRNAELTLLLLEKDRYERS